MPGLNFFADFKGQLNALQNSIIASQNSQIYSEAYFHRALLTDENYFLGFVKYLGYPIMVYEDEDFLIYMEGMIYNKNSVEVEKELKQLTEKIFHEHDRLASIREWILNADGEFIILIFNKESKEVVLFNDVLGRLPLYYYKGNEQVILSRSIGFIRAFLKGVVVDKMAIAEYLLFRIPLGNKTLLKDVYCLEAATLIYINPAEEKVDITRLHSINFEATLNEDTGLEDNAEQLKILFLKSCKDRANSFSDHRYVIGLSGGLDSRSVAAAFRELAIDCDCITRTMHPLTAQSLKESDTAQILSKVLNMSWKSLVPNTPSFQDLLKLLKMKEGMNYLAMSYLLPYLMEIHNAYGARLVYFTGDGGAVLKNHLPDRQLGNMDKMIDYVLQKNGCFKLDDVANMLQISKMEIRDAINCHIMQYPERELHQKYLHFFYYERIFKWGFEGEDRNRCYFWSTSPFYSFAFFHYALNCPQHQLRHYALYSKFLSKLSPEAVSIKSANWRYPINTIQSRLYFLIMQGVINKLFYKAKKIFYTSSYKKRHHFGLDVYQCVHEQIMTCSSLKDYFSIKELEKMIKGDLSYINFSILLSVISYIELIHSDHSSLTKFGDKSFI